jgi:uncharacterized protein (UPF0264 family)
VIVMLENGFFHTPTGLLVSVRSASEALEALAGGANVIDVKEPKRGPLGAADPDTISAVVRAVNDRVPVTAAMGELVDWVRAGATAASRFVPSGVSLVKLGLSDCRNISDWPTLWNEIIAAVCQPSNVASLIPRPVAVVYADWIAAQAPDPEQVLHAAVKLGCPALLIDTWDKSAGRLFDLWPIRRLGAFVREARAHQIDVVFAGSLDRDAIATAISLSPELVAVRTAACDGGRDGTVTAARVNALKRAISEAAQSNCTVAPRNSLSRKA